LSNNNDDISEFDSVVHNASFRNPLTNSKDNLSLKSATNKPVMRILTSHVGDPIENQSQNEVYLRKRSNLYKSKSIDSKQNRRSTGIRSGSKKSNK
jgi:hypothetical protein